MKIAFMTGLSDFNNTSLSHLQNKFLSKLDVDNNDKIYLNFPYEKTNKRVENVNIITASISNAIQYFLFRTKWLLKKESKLKEIINNEDKVILLVGSCGLEIIRNLSLSEEEKNKLFIISYGGVSKQKPKYKNLLLIQGDDDWIARLFIKECDIKVKSNHMNYLESEEFFNLVNNKVKEWI